MAKGKHRRPKQSQRQLTSRRSESAQGTFNTFSKVLVLVAMLLGVATIGVAFRGVHISVEMEP